MTSIKISRKINNIIQDGLVDVDPRPKRTLDEPVPAGNGKGDEIGLPPDQKNKNLAQMLSKIIKPEDTFDKEVR